MIDGLNASFMDNMLTGLVMGLDQVIIPTVSDDHTILQINFVLLYDLFSLFSQRWHYATIEDLMIEKERRERNAETSSTGNQSLA